MQTIIVEPVLEGSPRQVVLDLPAGWYRVLSGAVKPGDHYLTCDLFWGAGIVEWSELTTYPPPGKPYSTADWYPCLIRRGEPVEALCSRCYHAPVRLGYRYCRECCWKVVRELRRGARV